MDGLKLKNDFFKRLSETLINKILSKEQYRELKKNCFKKGIERNLEECVGHLTGLRNKLFAHLDSDSDKLERVTCDLGSLLLILADLYYGLSKMILFLSNPNYILDKKWDGMSKIPETDEERLAVFNNIFEIYPQVPQCSAILKFLERDENLENDCGIKYLS